MVVCGCCVWLLCEAKDKDKAKEEAKDDARAKDKARARAKAKATFLKLLKILKISLHKYLL